MDATEFSFESISKAEGQERKQPRLTSLESGLWPAFEAYLGALKENLRKEQDRNPSSRKIALLQDEFRNATRKAEGLWEAREKKITLFALKNARLAVSQPPENMIKDEREMYEALLRSFREHVPHVLRELAPVPEAPPPAPTAPRLPAPAPPAPPTTTPVPATAAVPGPATRTPEEVVTVRALVDLPPFVGIDGKTYRLKKGDVLTLPKKFGEILKQRGQVALMM